MNTAPLGNFSRSRVGSLKVVSLLRPLSVKLRTFYTTADGGRRLWDRLAEDGFALERSDYTWKSVN